MRICYVAHANSHFTIPYVDYFASRGHEVHLVSFHPGDLPNAIMHHPAGRAFDPEKHKWPYLLNAGKAIRMIREVKPDILHAHYVSSNGLLAVASGVHPLVLSARGDDVLIATRNYFRRRLISTILQRADLVNPVSAQLEERVLSLGVRRDRILRLTQGVTGGDFLVDRGQRRPGPIRMICTRRLAPEYQCDRIVGALSRLAGQATAWEFLFAATGPMEGALRQQVGEANLTGAVRFLGGFAQPDLPQLLGDADIYVSASVSDGTSPALLEAMASGAFPVVSDIPANREWLSGQGDGLLFDRTSARQLARHLTRAMEDEPLRRMAVAINRKRVAERGDRETNMGILATAYERLLRPHSP